MDNNKTEKKSSKYKQVFGVLSGLAQLALIIALLTVAVASFGHRIPILSRSRFNFFAVTSGSMEPTIPTGALLMVGKYDLSKLQAGDIITYQKRNEDSGQAAVVTHRIAEVLVEEEEQKFETSEGTKSKNVIMYTFKTKGDANTEADNYTVGGSEIIGLYTWHTPWLGYMSAFAQTPRGFISLVIIPAAVLILWEVISLVLYFKQYFEKKSAEEIEKLRAELATVKKHTKHENA